MARKSWSNKQNNLTAWLKERPKDLNSIKRLKNRALRGDLERDYLHWVS